MLIYRLMTIVKLPPWPAALDTIDREILQARLETDLCIAANVFSYFRSYLTSRNQVVSCGRQMSSPRHATCAVPTYIHTYIFSVR